MASLALGAAGAIVGSFFGPLGTSIGWAIGSAVGSALFAKGQDGPRLTDLKLQNSSYGQMIPLTWGTVRITGNVIWETDLQEHKQKSGGKGGPTVTTYTYSASFAVAICEGPINGILRIWADSRLVYDVATMSPTDFPFTLYLGDETQLADPTIESIEGVGNVNGNRGVAYVVFTDLFLTDYGNRIPSLSFEVYTSSLPIPWRYSTFPGTPPTVWNDDSRAGNGGSGPQSAAIEGGVLTLGWWTGHVGGSDIISMPATYEIQTFDLNGTPIDTPLSATAPAPPDIGGSSCLTLQCYNNPHIAWAVGGPATSSSVNINAFYYDGSITATPIFDPTGSTNTNVLRYALDSMLIFWDDAVYGTGGNIGAFISKWNAPGGAVLNGNPIAHYYLPSTHGGSAWTTKVDTVTGRIWCIKLHSTGAGYDEIYVFDTDLNVIVSVPFANWPGTFIGTTGSYDIWNSIFYFQGPGSNTAFAYRFDELTGLFTLADDGGGSGSLGTFGGALGVLKYNGISLGNGLVLIGNGIVSLQARSGPVTLAEIVSDLSVRSGLLTSQIDVSELTDLVDGYVISQQAATRPMIEPLQTAYFFDAVESDTLAKFVKRGKDSEATIPVTDLGTYAKGSAPPPLITSMRLQEVDLPRSISAVYLNIDAEYQNGTQLSQRLITSSELTVSLQLAIVMDDTKAKEITDALLFNAWLEREKITFLLPRKWIYLEPTDVVTAAGYRVRVVDKGETVAGVIKFDGVVTAPYVFTQTSIAVPGLAPPPGPPPVAGITDLLMLDIPLVNDADYPNGYYAAMAGHAAGSWPGATLYKSIDGGVNFDSLLANVVPDIIGVTTSVLGNYTGGNTFDEINSVGVQLTGGSAALASAAAIDVLNGANECLVGNELMQFKNAVLTAPGAYTLSGLLRGRRGTEWAVAAAPSGSRFVMLPTSTNVNGPFAEIFATRDFKAVTSGAALSSATDVPFVNNGMALRCYSPTAVGGGLNAAGDLTISWIRRTRIGGTWQNFVDVPLSEASEAYVVQIWNATFTECARVITGITSPSVIYTSAQQVTDFGAQQQTIYVTVGQLGTLGLGVQSPGVLQGAGASVDAPLSPVPPYGSGPPVPPPSGGCTGTVFNATLTFAVGVAVDDSPGGFGPGANWVLKLTTPASGNYLGQLNFYEHGGPPCTKTGVLATSACGVPIPPVFGGGPQSGVDIALYFSVGDPFYPSIYCQLEHATDYYFSLQTSCFGTSAYALHIFDN